MKYDDWLTAYNARLAEVRHSPDLRDEADYPVAAWQCDLTPEQAVRLLVYSHEGVIAGPDDNPIAVYC